MSNSTPKFRLVQGRQIGERSSTPQTSSAPSHPLPPAPILNQHVAEPQLPALNQHQMPINSPPPPMPMDQSPAMHHPATSSANMGQGPPQLQQQQPPPPPQMQPRPEHDAKGAVTKCIRFLKTLINLSHNSNQQEPTANANSAMLVRGLIGNVIYGDITAEEFTSRLQQALNSQAQPHLLPFLQNTIPALRAAVRNGEVSMEGISPPPGYVFNNLPQIPVSQPPPQQQHQQQQQQQTPAQIQHQKSQLKSRLSSTPQQQQMHQMPPQQQRVNVGPPTPLQMHQPMGPGGSIPQQQPPKMGQHVNQPSTSHPVDMRQEDENPNTRSFTETTLKSAILSPQEIMNRITRRMMESCAVEEEALTLICDAAEAHLRELITQMASIAEHRAENLRMPDHYVPVDDTKRQLRFLEDLDKQEEEMRESREKESLIRQSKNKNTGKETIEKAKEMQRVDAEAKRNRDANAAAIAALSSNRTVKNKWESGTTGSSAPQRPRTIRVTTRDLHIIVNTDNRFNGTFIREKLAYGGPSTDATI